MRVLVTTPDFPPQTGGIQLLVAQLVRHLEPLDVSVVTLDDRDAATTDRELGWTVHRVGRSGDHRLSVARLNAATIAQAARTRPDALVSAHIVTGMGALAAGRMLRVPTVQYTHAKELGTRGGLARRVLRHADAIIAVSSHTARGACECGARPERVHVVHPGVDAPENGAAPAAREPIILTVARLEDRYKGFDVLMRAMPLILARVPEARWVVVGDGPLREELEATAVRWNLDAHIEFAGPVTDGQRDALLARASLFAMPSRTPARIVGGEGFGIVYLEAARFGLPAIAGDAGGAVDAVLDGVTGLLVDPRDHVAVADAAVDLLLDPLLAGRLGAAGRARAAELSWSRMGREVRAILTELVAA